MRGFLFAAAVGVTAVMPAMAEPLTFVAIGDLPYDEAQEKTVEAIIAPAIRDRQPPFVIHLGDIKSGGLSCSDKLLTQRRDEIYSLYTGPVFYTPGDNDWTDCDRSSLTEPMPELERLDYLRRLFFSKPPALPAGSAYARQPEWTENARWTTGGVTFATVHVVGTNNGRDEILLDDVETALDLVDARDQANLEWLAATFDAAEEAGSAAVVIAMQADITKAALATPCSAEIRVLCDGFARFRDRLVRHAAAFRKPVLLMHGDTSPYCLDKRFGGRVARNLWRLNAPGDGLVIDAVEITVLPDDQKAPFAVKTLVGGHRLRRDCR